MSLLWFVEYLYYSMTASLEISPPERCGAGQTPGWGGIEVESPASHVEEGARASRRNNRSRAGRHAHTFAALDLGTNNCRLLVAKPLNDREGFRVINAFSRIVRLGERVSETGVLSEAAIQRTIRALRVCAGKMERRGVTRVRSVATEACRRAQNCDEFIERVFNETRITFDIISTDEEAQLALAGCAPLLNDDAEYALVFDIGGGSTELMFLKLVPGAKSTVLDVISFPCGVVTLSERFGGHDVPPDAYEAMVNEALSLLAPFEAANNISGLSHSGQLQMLGTSGTVTTLAAVNLGLPKYDRSQVDGRWIGGDAIATMSQRLVQMTYEERADHPCIKRGRADLVVAGCAILEAIMRNRPVSRVRVADRGLREGILIALMLAADQDPEDAGGIRAGVAS